MDFINYCKTGNLQQVQLLLQNGYVPNANDYAIQWASEYGHLDIVKLLLDPKYGCDPTAYKNYAIQMASFEGHLDVVQLLLQHGCDPTDYDNLAIQFASKNGHLDLVKLLLQHGCDPTDDDNLAIRSASKNCHLDVVKLLFKWYLIHRIELPNIKPLNKIKKEIIYEIFLIYELMIPEDLCNLIQKFS
jgi:ankyrin repeat protein